MVNLQWKSTLKSIHADVKVYNDLMTLLELSAQCVTLKAICSKFNVLVNKAES